MIVKGTASRLHPHFREVMQLLASQAADEARHVEVFTRRGMLTGGPLGTSSAGGRASLQSLLSEPVMRRIDSLAEQGNPGAQELATYWVGQGVGLMNKATTVRDVVYEMARDFAEAAEHLARVVSD